MSEEILPTDIAVVGMAGRFPGAQTADAYWHNLLTGVESITTLSRQELLAAGETDAALAHANYVPRWAGLDDIPQFDAAFFGLSRREGDVMDPQHRHFLEVCVEALEDANLAPSRFAGNVAVYASSGYNAYFPTHVLTHRQLLEDVGFFLLRHTGNDKDFLATRVAYCLGLRGPAVNVQTACSSSLVAIHMAAQSLIARECDAALAGGVTIDFPVRRGYIFRDGEILAPDGHCRAFDALSQGTVFGSGAGAVVLKRLEDAVAAGDAIYAVVKGSAINNDGNSKVGYLAPSVEGQARCITEALAMSGVSAEQVGYVECHGTGTPVGDPIEVQALTDAFRQTTSKAGYCAIGSVKPNIGHLDTAAGVASFIKAARCVQSGELAPTLHFSTPNPRIDFPSTPFFVVAKRQGWTLPGVRYATVNSLGVGGTNAHVVLAQPPLLPVTTKSSRRFFPLMWSAKSEKSADAFGQRLQMHHGDAASVSASLLLGRERFTHRRAAASGSLSELTHKRIKPVQVEAAERRLIFVFSGGGAAHPGMGRDLYAHEPIYRKAIDRVLQLVPGNDVRTALFSADAHALMERPLVQLPAQIASQLAMAELLSSFGVTPQLMMGHSLGEYAAAHLAGVFDLQSCMQIVLARAELFESLPEGAMLSIALDEASVRARLPHLDIAAHNAPQSTVVAGPRDQIDAAEATLKAADVDCRRLHIAVAAHSSMLEGILPAFSARISGLRFFPPRSPFVSTATGKLATAEVASADYWVRHLRNTVRFDEGLQAALAAGPAVLVDVGPGHGLAGVLRHRAGLTGSVVVTAMRHATEVVEDDRVAMQAVAELVALDVAKPEQIAAQAPAPLTHAPTYAFDHQTHWLEPQHASSIVEAIDPLAEQSLDRWFWKRSERALAPRAGAEGIAAENDNTRLWWLGDDRDAVLAQLRNTDRFLPQDEQRLLYKIAHDPLPNVVVYAGDDFETAIALVRALIERDADESPRLVVLSNDARMQGALGVASRELAGLRCRWIRRNEGAAGPTQATVDAQTVAAAITAPSHMAFEQWQIREGRVYERMLERARVPLIDEPPAGSALVWGGATGIGLEVAIALSRAGHRVTVASRSEAQPATRARAPGVIFTRGDVTQKADVERVLKEAGGVRWVYLCAGVLDDQPIVAKSREQRARVMAPKIDGLKWNRELLPRQAQLVLFSSTSTHLTPAGQVDYVAANAVLDAADDSRIKTVAWGMWRDVGMLGRKQTPPIGHPFVDRALSTADWVLDEHRLADGTAVLPGTAYLEILRARVQAPFAPFAFADIEMREAFVHQAGRATPLSARLEGEELTVHSGQTVHVSARVSKPGGHPAQLAPPEIKPITTAWQQQPHALRFGPRWQVVKGVTFGSEDAWARLSLDARFHDDLAQIATHPALLDLATAFALSLAGEPSREQVFVPVRYGHYEQWAPLPADILSHVKLTRHAADTVVFQVTITTPDGVVLALARDFTMRAVPARNLQQKEPQTLLRLGATRGITTDAGLRALWSALASTDRHLYVSSIDLEALAQIVEPELMTPRVQAAPAATSQARDDVEKQLIDMFESLLGAHPVGRDDDFFALGGHSLLAVRLFNRIKKQLGADLSLSVLFEAPTVARLAVLIRGDAPEQTTEARPQRVESRGVSLVPIQRGGMQRRAFFCVHGAGGNVLNFRDLVGYLSPDQPFFGLQARGVDGLLTPHTSIIDMARDYLSEVRRVQPQGPYLLGGYSGGGVVAYEMAQQLLGAGEQVAALVFLDTFVPGLKPRGTSLRERALRLRAEGFGYARKAAEWAIERRLRNRFEQRQLQEALARGGAIPFELRDAWLTGNFQRLADAYTLKPYAGRTLLFRAAETDPYFAYVGDKLGWEKWMNQALELVVVPGNHDTLMMEPNVFTLARELDRALGEI